MSGERGEVGSGSGSDSFDALLREAAHVSTVGRGAVLAAGTALSGGKLSIVQKLGEGGMGVVYEAFDAERRQRVALKTLTRMDPASVYRLKNEFRALAEVTHDNLVQLHALWNDDELWCFTMERVDGSRFDQWVRPAGDGERQGPLDEARLRAALPQLVAAVGAIHAAGKLHRDLKPSNVLVTPEGRVVVLDFGLAVSPGRGSVGQTVADDRVSGTPAYMAPEQAAGRGATAASDWYAVGVMLFEALTGRLPFEGTAGELLAAKQTVDAPRASTVSEAPPDLDGLCAALLSRDPAARPDGAALRAQLGVPASRSGDTRSRSLGSGAPPEPHDETATVELLGRDAELAALHDAFDATCAGEPVVVFVSGESGMGKSALCGAFVSKLASEGRATVLSGRCYERENVPFKGFDSLVDDLSRHLRRLPPEEAAAVLPRETYALARVFPVLDRVSVVAAAPKRDIADPQELKRRAFEAFGELLTRVRDRAPLVLLLDDLQWLDQDSARFMEHLMVHPQPAPVLVLCAHRSEGAADDPLLSSVVAAAGTQDKIRVRHLSVGPLEPLALEALARRLLPEGASTEAVEAMAREARGSPFFAATIARAAELGETLERPPSLGEALELRLGALPAGAQRLLSLLALSGQPLPTELVADASGLSDAHGLLDRLSREQLARVSIDADGARHVECYHDKIREHRVAALDALQTQALALDLSRVALHREAPDEELLARLLTQAGKPEDAAEHAARAAEQAARALAFDHAAQLYAQALEQGQFEPDRTQALRVGRARALARAGQGVPAAEAYLEASAGAEGEAAAELMREAGAQYLYCGELERGREVFGEGLRRLGFKVPRGFAGTLASTLWSSTRLRLRGLAFSPRNEFDLDALRELDVLALATLTLIRSDQFRAAYFCALWVRRALDAGHPIHAARALAWQLLVETSMSADRKRGDAIQALCERLCDETGDAESIMWLHYTRAQRRLFLEGDAHGKLEDTDRALELCLAHPLASAAYDLAWIHTWRGVALLSQGRFQEAAELCLAHLAQASARGDRTVGPVLAAVAAMSSLALDRADQAVALIEEALVDPTNREMVVADTQYLGPRGLCAVYQEQARHQWYAEKAHRERFLASFQGRFITRGWVEAVSCGIAAVAARECTDDAERAALLQEALRLARRGVGATNVFGRFPTVIAACIRGDRDGSLRALRTQLARPNVPLYHHVGRRHLGRLLGDAEGAAMIAEADAFLRAGGCVYPERFADAMLPGVFLNPAGTER